MPSIPKPDPTAAAAVAAARASAHGHTLTDIMTSEFDLGPAAAVASPDNEIDGPGDPLSFLHSGVNVTLPRAVRQSRVWSRLDLVSTDNE
jgi:hypothetical protein